MTKTIDELRKKWQKACSEQAAGYAGLALAEIDKAIEEKRTLACYTFPAATAEEVMVITITNLERDHGITVSQRPRGQTSISMSGWAEK